MITRYPDGYAALTGMITFRADPADLQRFIGDVIRAERRNRKRIARGYYHGDPWEDPETIGGE